MDWLFAFWSSCLFFFSTLGLVVCFWEKKYLYFYYCTTSSQLLDWLVVWFHFLRKKNIFTSYCTSFQLLDWLVVWFHWEGRLSEPAGREQEIYSSELDLYIIPLQITTDRNEIVAINTLKDYNCAFTATHYWETKKN